MRGCSACSVTSIWKGRPAMKHLVNTRPQNDNGQRDVFVPGDRVVLTADALRSMGVHAVDCVAKVWTVRECFCQSCRTGRLVCTDQPTLGGSWRHLARSSLRHAGVPTGDDLPVGGFVAAGKWH